MSISERLAEVLGRIEDAARRAGRDPCSVRLVAVSKLQPVEAVLEAYAAGQRVFGENYVQELEKKRAAVPIDAEWHLIGHLQTNKAKRAAELAAMVHSVDSEKIARALAKAAEKPLPVLIEVNVGGEGSKSGVDPARAEPLLLALRAVPGLEVRGLMCIPPPGPSARASFATLRELRDRLAAASGLGLPELSMGMSDDFEEAILEGATLIRVGTRIFGARPRP